MGWHIVERIKGLFEGRKSADDAPETESDSDTSPSLYKCPDCETTYISEEMQSCPECGGAVEQRPSATELGMGSDRD